jgi:hypothetical protein
MRCLQVGQSCWIFFRGRCGQRQQLFRRGRQDRGERRPRKKGDLDMGDSVVEGNTVEQRAGLQGLAFITEEQCSNAISKGLYF